MEGCQKARWGKTGKEGEQTLVQSNSAHHRFQENFGQDSPIQTSCSIIRGN